MPNAIELAAAPSSSRSGWAALGLASLRENAPLLLLVAAFMAAANGLLAQLGRPQRVLDQAVDSYAGYVVICTACVIAIVILWILHTTLVRKISIQSRTFWLLIPTELLGRERILLAAPILAVWPVVALSFSLVKALIPSVIPYYLDPFLYAADRALHFGHDPWMLLQPLLGHPVITYAIDRLYALWMFVVYFAMLLQITSTGNRRLRMHFLLSSMLAWIILGSVAATLLSSAGPCYFGKVVGTMDPYARLMTYLRDVVQRTPPLGIGAPPELIALRVQDLLWYYYQENEIGLGRGISAAPSLHVASTWLVARMLQGYGRGAAIAGWSFFAVILLGSVHLGWHYALDGYLSIAGAWLLWRFAGWFLDRPVVQSTLWPRRLAPPLA